MADFEDKARTIFLLGLNLSELGKLFRAKGNRVQLGEENADTVIGGNQSHVRVDLHRVDLAFSEAWRIGVGAKDGLFHGCIMADFGGRARTIFDF